VCLATLPPDEAGLAAFTHLLGPDERARAARFTVAEPRRQFVLGRIILRQWLGACLGVDPATLELGGQSRGKPCLTPSAGHPDLRFNLAHSGRRLAVAMACGRDVGVDIEWIQPLPDWLSLAGRIFSPRERDELLALPEPRQLAAFFNGWTRKEAWLKATGEGLTDDLPAIEVTLDPDREPALLALPGGPPVVRQWVMRALPLPPDFAGAVVFKL
jgi:4'-phosphopantetheinyl transferase